jgi:ATP-binding cassette subfamily B protein
MIVLFLINPKIMIGMLTSFGLFYFIISFYTKKLVRENGEKMSKNSNIVVKSLQEGLGGIRDIILDGSQELYCKSYYAADYSLRKAVGDNQVIAVIPRYAVEAFGIILIVTFTYFEMVNGVGISSIIPVLGAFALGAQRAMPTLQQMYASQIAIRGSKEIFMDVLSLLQQPMPTVNNENKSIQIPFENNLELRNVSFQYSKDSPWILHNINLNIKKGEMIGFVGETGSGKSTLLDIIMGLITQTNGEILVDGTPINSLNIKGWRHHVSHVPQNIFLLDGSLEENISFNSVEDDIDFIRIESASEAANLSKVVERLKEGYKTIVGERGSKLSGGQCQRVGIARALYKQSELMILDEATSALDGITEKDIMKKIDDLNDNLTILIVAHRVTTLKKCDRIFKVKGGDLFSIEYSELLEHT